MFSRELEEGFAVGVMCKVIALLLQLSQNGGKLPFEEHETPFPTSRLSALKVPRVFCRVFHLKSLSSGLLIIMMQILDKLKKKNDVSFLRHCRSSLEIPF